MKPENILPTASKEANNTQPTSTTFSKRLRRWTHSFWLMIQRFFISSTSTPLWLPAILRPWYMGYLIAIALQMLIVFLIALVIHLYAPFSFIEAPILLGIVFLSLGWGPGPGILATISGGILFDLLILPPYFSFPIYRTKDIIGILLYLVIGITIGLMASQTQRARRQAQSASSKASTLQHQLYELFMQAPTPITVLRGPEHRFELVNPLTQHSVGERQIIGMPMREALPEYVEQGIIDRLDQVYATGKSMTIPELRAETRQYLDGKSTPIEQYFTVIYQPTRTPQGEVDGIVIFNVDVTAQVHARKQMEQVLLERDQERTHLGEVLLAEQALREVAENATRQLQAIFEAIADPVFIVDAETGPRQMNRAGRELLNIPEALATRALHFHKRFFELYDEQGQILPEEAWPQTKILAGAILRGPTAVDVVMHTSSGGIFRLSVTGAPLRSETGEVVAAVLVCRDVTERRSLEQRLRQAEQVAAERASQLEAVFEAITDGVFILDPRKTSPQLNPAAREFLEITNDAEIDIKQGPPFELLDEHGQPLPAELWPEAYLRKGERLLSKDAMDVLFRARTGRIRALSVTGAPLWSPEGRVSGAVLVCRDVTERRQLERQTQESLQSLLILAESLVSLPAMNGEIGDIETAISPIEVVAKRLVVLIRSVLGCKRVSITTYDAHTQTLRSAAVIGLSPDQERQWKKRIPGFRLSDSLAGETLQTQFERGNAIALDMSEPPFTSQPNPYGIKTMLLVPMRLETRLVGILSLDYGGEDRQFKDNEKTLAKAVAELAALILERERLLEERAESQANVLALQEANRLKDEFIGIAGHELRTPLTTIKASVQLARRQITRFSKQEKALSTEGTSLLASLQTLLDRAERQVGMQNRLVNDLLDVSRIEVGKLELYPALHDLVALVREVVEDQRALTSQRQILFEANTVEEDLVQVDADRLRQVITNYLTNALKYSEAEKPIVVRIVHVASRVRVEVEDKGPGLTQTQQQRIWERFYRVPGIEVRSGSGVGLGLGLHISRMIIERHDGQVGVRSTPGEGSIFWFELPQAE